MRKLVNVFFGGSVTDIMTGYRAFSHMFVKSFPVLSKGFEIETEITIHALDKNLSLISIPVEYRDRPQGSVSKLNTFSDGFKVLKTIGRLVKDYKPSPFFSCLSGACMIAAVFISGFKIYYKTGLASRLPTFVAAGFMSLFYLQLLACGFILDTNNKNNRQNFELQMNILRELELNKK